MWCPRQSVPRCECRSEECDDEPGSVEGITLIMHALGFLEQQPRQPIRAKPAAAAPVARSFETSSVDSGVDLAGDAMTMGEAAGLIPNSGGPMVLPNSVDGEVSDIRLISELGAEGRIRMGRFQAELLEWKRLSVRLVNHSRFLIQAAGTYHLTPLETRGGSAERTNRHHVKQSISGGLEDGL